MQIRNGWLAYQLNEAVQLFGQHVQYEIDSQKSNFHREVRLRELLDLPMAEKKINVGAMAASGGVRIRPKVTSQGTA